MHFPNITEISFVIYRLDNHAENPYSVWKSNGSPQQPSQEVFQAMRMAEVYNQILSLSLA